MWISPIDIIGHPKRRRTNLAPFQLPEDWQRRNCQRQWHSGRNCRRLRPVSVDVHHFRIWHFFGVNIAKIYWGIIREHHKPVDFRGTFQTRDAAGRRKSFESSFRPWVSCWWICHSLKWGNWGFKHQTIKDGQDGQDGQDGGWNMWNSGPKTEMQLIQST